MPNEESFDEREEALRYAARLNGLTLVRTGDAFALAHYKLTGVTLDEIAAFLGTDGGSPEAENCRAEEHRRADLRALLKAEHAMTAEREEERRKATNLNQTATESELAEIHRRLAEIVAWQDIKHSANSLR